MADELIDVAYSVTVDINTYITRAVNSNARKIKKNNRENIFSELLIFIIFKS